MLQLSRTIVLDAAANSIAYDEPDLSATGAKGKIAGIPNVKCCSLRIKNYNKKKIIFRIWSSRGIL